MGNYLLERARKKVGCCLYSSTVLTRFPHSNCSVRPSCKSGFWPKVRLSFQLEKGRGRPVGKAGSADCSAIGTTCSCRLPLPGARGKMADGCVWIEDVEGTGAPTSLRPKMGFCPPCACHHPPAVIPLAPRWRGGRQNFFKKEMKTGNYCIRGRWEGRWENGLECVCACAVVV